MNRLNRIIGTGRRRIITLSLLGLIVLFGAVMFYVDHEPDPFNVVARAEARAERNGHEPVTGYVTAATLVEVMNTMLNKRGGYLNNDVMPPFVFLDNMPSWETGGSLRTAVSSMVVTPSVAYLSRIASITARAASPYRSK